MMKRAALAQQLTKTSCTVLYYLHTLSSKWPTINQEVLTRANVSYSSVNKKNFIHCNIFTAQWPFSDIFTKNFVTINYLFFSHWALWVIEKCSWTTGTTQPGNLYNNRLDLDERVTGLVYWVSKKCFIFLCVKRKIASNHIKFSFDY